MNSGRVGVSVLGRGEHKKWNPYTVLFVVVAVLALVVLVTGIASLIFPDAGIPFLWIAFPIGPQPAPIPG